MSLSLEQFGIDLLWDSLPPDTPFVPPDWHLPELERRTAAADANPEAAEPWETGLARLSKRP